jgi:YVTN family beta-propeller protein
MDFRILGPLEVADNGREPVIAPGKQRALLGILLLHANEVVSSDRLIEELWGEQPPASAAKSLQVHVSRLRRALNGDHGNGADNVVVTRGGGYLIRVTRGELDRERFEALVAHGAQELVDGAPARALTSLEEALALWRGPPLADFAYESFAQPEIARLDELHLAAIELRIESELALGRTAQAIPELESLVGQHPFRERLRGLLMLALYRSGRQADALEAYQQARRALVDELGIEPGEPLRELERAILAQDPAIDAPPVTPEPAQRVGRAAEAVALPRGRLRWATLALGVLAAVGAVAVAVLLGGPDDGTFAPLTDDSHAVASIDPDTNEVTDVLSVGSRPGSLAYDRATDSLWVANLDDKTVTHIDPEQLSVGKTVPIGGAPTDLAAGGGAVWVASHPRGTRVRLDKINARFDTHERTVRVGDLAGEVNRLALGDGALWVAPEWGLLTRVDARTGAVVRPAIDPKHHPTGIAADGDAVWAAGGEANTVTRVDARTGLATPIPVGNGPAEIALGGRGVWVALALDDALVRIDPETGAVQRTIPVGDSPAGVTVGAGSVWVANSGDGTVSRIDRRTSKVVATISVGASPQDVTVADGRVWVSVRPRARPEGAPGGAARVEVAQGVDSMDPAFGWGVYEHQLGYATGLKLLNYPDAPAPAGAQLEPEAAESLPTSHDGRTYTFTIRKGFRFSPPSGEPVTAETFRYSIERALSPKMKGDAGLFASDIVGAQRYMDGKADHIAGLTVDGNQLRIRLTRVAGDFPARISMPMFAAVPTDTPPDPDLGKVASAGPYYVDSFAPREGVVLKRNPNYHGGRPHRFKEIRLVAGVQRVEATRHVEDGTADYAPGNEFVGALPDARRLAKRYGPGSEAAALGEQRYFVNPVLALDYIALNTSRPLFSSPRLRRAVNYAVDRRALAAQGGLELGLPSTPSDQYLPPGMPGFSDAHIYPLRPNLEKAKRLAGGGERTAVLYAYDRPPSPQVAQLVKSSLRPIGIDVDIKLFAKGVYFKRLGRKGEPYDMAIQGWFADYADPADFLSPLDGRTLDPKSFLSGAFLNSAKFDDPAVNRRLLAAEKLSGPRRYAAYSRIEHDMVRDAAPWIAIGNEASPDFFSARMGCQVYHPVYGIDLAALCIRQ